MSRLVEAAAAAGVHWLYSHPLCRHWDEGRPEPEPQSGVLEEIGRLKRDFEGRIEIDLSVQRYEDFPLRFSAYHAAHFLLVVGADGKNYLGPEVKYHPDFAVADLSDGLGDGFLRDPARLARIAAADSLRYRAQGSRHRGVLYNDFIKRPKRSGSSAIPRLSGSPISFRPIRRRRRTSG